MKSLFLVCVFIVSSSICLIAQDQSSNDYHNYLGIEARFNSRDSNLEGSPYVTENYVPGYIIFENSYKLDNIQLRYNAYHDNLEVKVKGTEYTAKTSDIKEFVFTDPATKKPVTYRNLPLGGKGASMVEVMFDGATKLVSRNEMQRGKGKSSGAGYEVLNPAKDVLTLVQKLYLVKGTEVTKLARSKKSVIKALADHGNEVEKFIDDNDIDVKDNVGLVRVIEYYNGL